MYNRIMDTQTINNQKKGEAMEPDTIKINEVEYVRKDATTLAPVVEGMQYCIVRTYSAGVCAGYVESRTGQEVTMRNARRLYYWDGAATLSQLAMEGGKAPQTCKFPQAVETVTLLQAIEIIPCTTQALKSKSEGR